MHRVEFVKEKVLRAQVNAKQGVAVASQSFSGGIPQRDVNTCELFQLEGTPTRRDLSSALPTLTRVHVPQEHLQIVVCVPK